MTTRPMRRTMDPSMTELPFERSRENCFLDLIASLLLIRLLSSSCLFVFLLELIWW